MAQGDENTPREADEEMLWAKDLLAVPQPCKLTTLDALTALRPRCGRAALRDQQPTDRVRDETETWVEPVRKTN